MRGAILPAMPALVSSTNSLWRDLRQLPRSYWVLFSGTLINRFGHFVIPFLALYLADEGYASWVTKASLSAYGGGFLLASLIGGYLADRVGRKPTILVSCLAGAATLLALSQVHAPGWIVVFSGLVGLSGAVYMPASSALLIDLVPSALRLRAFACQRLAGNLGFAGGMATAGWVAEYSYLPLFIADAATTVVLGVMVLFFVPPGKPARRENAGWGAALAVMRRDHAYIRAILASFLMGVVFLQLSSSWAFHVTDLGGHREKVYGFLIGLNGLMIVLFELPLTSWTMRHSGPRMMMWGYLLMGLSIGLSVFGGALLLLVLVMVLFSIGEMISSPVASAYVAHLAPDDMRGRYMGVLGISWAAATMVGPVVGITLFEASPPLLWLACLVLGVVAAVLVGGIREGRG